MPESGRVGMPILGLTGRNEPIPARQRPEPSGMEAHHQEQRYEGRGDSARQGLLRRLIAERLVEPVFQPIVDLQQGAVAGFEALTRPARASGFANPTELFDAAAEAGMLWELEMLTRRAAMEAATSWNTDVLLFINCSPQVFADPRFAGEVRAGVGQTAGLSPSRVVLEITERSDQEYVEGLAEQVTLLKQQGFQIAIDDVGAGTSGLNRIMKLRPHWLKLDRNLIDSIDGDRVKQNLIKFLAHFARLSGVTVVAEGVEREQELATLTDLGIVYAQGYYLGRPGGREQTLDPAIADRLRMRWSAALANRRGVSGGSRIARLMRPVRTVPSDASAAAVAASPADAPGAPGVAVLDGSRYLGWCPQKKLTDHPECSVGALVTPEQAFLGPDASIADGLELLGSREDATIALPLAIIERGRVLGIVPVRDLLAAAAELSRNGPERTVPVTGLPGRVLADEHLEKVFAAARQGRPGPDAAIIDILGFADYNGAYGYELGDQLLRSLGDLIRSTVVLDASSIYLAHLGDDRFLVTAPAHALEERIPTLAAGFAEMSKSLRRGVTLVPALDPVPTDAGGVEPVQGPGIGLRIVLVPDVVGVASDVREFYRMASELRNARPDPFPMLAGSRCVLIRERRRSQRPSRLSA